MLQHPEKHTFVLSLVALGCAAATPGASPHDMSAARHEVRANEHDQRSAEHAAEYDPKARETVVRCGGSRQRVSTSLETGACWTSVRNPTASHARQAAEHRRHAADHRAASANLRRAEAESCRGLASDDRDMSPFAHVEDIASVEEWRRSAGVRDPSASVRGAIVTFRAVEGMTAEWLQRVIDCHIARNSALGHVAPEMADCPLVPKGVSARVTSTGSGFAVSIEGEDAAAAEEILARSRRLLRAR